jgi:predicted dehydrogenase
MKRRDFIGLGGAAVTGISLAPNKAFSQFLDDKNPIQVGVIGTGGRGNWLIKLVQDIPGMEVTACCDVLPFRLEQGMRLASKNAKAYANYRELLEQNNLDAVIISTPLNEHYQMALDAIDSGKHVYCEKTMTYSIEQALDLSEKVKKSDLKFQVGYQHRYNPLYQNIYNTIKEGYIGEITQVEAHWNRNGNWRRNVPDEKYEKLINWRMYKEYSGGLMAELCSHQIDIIDYVLEAHMERVTGFGGIDYWKDGRETFDNVFSLFEYPGGIKASFHSVTTNSHEGFNIKIYGTKATILVEGEGGHMGYIYPEPKTIREIKEQVDGVSSATMKILEAGEPIPIVVPDFETGDRGTTTAALAHFGHCIQTGDEVIANAEFGKRSAISVSLANKAMEEGSIESWKSIYSN